jgi:DNA-directed RNA polymerase subunit RPC12/RpoP
MSDKHVCKKCNREFLWIQGNPQQLSQVEQLICAKENLPFAIMKKITCPYCGTQSLAQEPAR